MKPLLAFLISALAIGPLYCQTPPSQATAAGMTQLVLSNDFTSSSEISTDKNTHVRTPGTNWYPFRFGYGSGATAVITPGTTTVAGQSITGLLTLNGGANLSTVRAFDSSTTLPVVVQGGYHHFYVEARMQVVYYAPATGSWPAFWSYGTSSYWQTTPTNYATAKTSEFDFYEWYPNAVGTNISMISSAHDWMHNSGGASGTELSGTNGQNYDQLPNKPTDGGWHIMGALWAPLTATTGYLEWYFDNNLMVLNNGVTRVLTGVGTGTSSGAISTINGHVCYTPKLNGLSNQEADNMMIIMGSGQTWASNWDWVHIFQSPTGVAQTLTPFPATATTPITSSPYSLPSATSAGLTPTYTVFSGPATVAGNVLTFSAPGSVVVNATQAGNSTYASYSGGETITVTQPAPAAPTNLWANSGNGQIFLGWGGTAVTWTLSRSTTNGSGYAVLASGIATKTYTDSSVVNGTPYYYVVQGVNAGGISPNSNQVTQTAHGISSITVNGSPVPTSSFSGKPTATIVIQSQ